MNIDDIPAINKNYKQGNKSSNLNLDTYGDNLILIECPEGCGRKFN
jgi:hypothetical protein